MRDGFITADELGAYLRTSVPLVDPRQHPQIDSIRPQDNPGAFFFYTGRGSGQQQSQLPASGRGTSFGKPPAAGGAMESRPTVGASSQPGMSRPVDATAAEAIEPRPITGTWHELRTTLINGQETDVGLDFIFGQGSGGVVAAVQNRRRDPPRTLATGQGSFIGGRLRLALETCPGVEEEFGAFTATLSSDGITLAGTRTEGLREIKMTLFKRQTTNATLSSAACGPYTPMAITELAGTWRSGNESITFELVGNQLRGTIIRLDPCGQPTLRFPLEKVAFTPTRIGVTYRRKLAANAYQCPGESYRRPFSDTDYVVTMSGMIERSGPYSGGLWFTTSTSPSGGGEVFRRE